MTEKQKLDEALKEFAQAMAGRLNEKRRDGFAGWDDGFNSAWDMEHRMGTKVLRVIKEQEQCDPQDLVDIANFAMFLHHSVTQMQEFSRKHGDRHD